MQWALRRTEAIVLLGLFLLAVSGPSAQEVTDDRQTAPPGTIFNEIELTPEGVIAYDTAGERWYYDFEERLFVAGYPPTGEGPSDFDAGIDDLDQLAPVQERCTNEKRIQPSHKKVTISWDEFVDGDVITFGPVTVHGWVRGGIQSYKGRVLVAESGQVDGDIRAPDIVVKPGGMVGGEIHRDESMEAFTDIVIRSFSTDGIWIVFGFTVFLLAIGFIVTP